MNVHDQIAILEKQLAELKKQVGPAGRDPVPAIKAFEEPRGVQVRELLVERNDLPSLQDLRKLFTIVKPHVPGVDRINRDDPDRALVWWTSECKTWLQSRSVIAGDVSGPAYIAAALAAGDVPYVRGDLSVGHTWEFGLLPYGGKPGADAWKNVLATGRILQPSRPVRRAEMSSPVRMIGF